MESVWVRNKRQSDRNHIIKSDRNYGIIMINLHYTILSYFINIISVFISQNNTTRIRWSIRKSRVP